MFWYLLTKGFLTHLRSMPQKWRDVDEGWLFCHWWQDLYGRRLSAMELIFFLLAVALLAAVSLPFGSDSRNLTEDAWHRDSLWSRSRPSAP